MINSATDEELFEIENGQVINLSEIETNEISFRAYTNPEPTGSVLFNMEGPELYTHIENKSYYALYANDGENFFSWKPTLGTDNLLVIPYTEPDGRGDSGKTLFISFSIIDEPAHQIEKFTLIDAVTNEELFDLNDGDVVNLHEIGTSEINIKAYTNPDPTGSVQFSLTGAHNHDHIENVSYYALFANEGNNFFSWTPVLGEYELTATPYSEKNAKGNSGEPKTINFTIENTENNMSRISAKVFPNPGNNLILIPSGDSHNTNPQIRMHNLEGKEVNGISFQKMEDDQIFMDVSNLEKNIYIIHVITENDIKTYRWQKE